MTINASSSLFAQAPLLLPRSKTDAAGEGARVGVPRGQHAAICPIRALQAWLQAAGIRFGPAFCWMTHWGTVEAGRPLSGEAVRQGAAQALAGIRR